MNTEILSSQSKAIDLIQLLSGMTLSFLLPVSAPTITQLAIVLIMQSFQYSVVVISLYFLYTFLVKIFL